MLWRRAQHGCWAAGMLHAVCLKLSIRTGVHLWLDVAGLCPGQRGDLLSSPAVHHQRLQLEQY